MQSFQLLALLLVVTASVLSLSMTDTTPELTLAQKTSSVQLANLDVYLRFLHIGYCLLLLTLAGGAKDDTSVISICSIHLIVSASLAVLTRFGLIAKCNCFGNLDKTHPVVSKLLKYTLLLVCALTLALTLLIEGETNQFLRTDLLAYRLSLFATTIGVLALLQLSQVSRQPSKNVEKKQLFQTATKAIDLNLRLGSDAADKAITLKDFEASQKYLLILGLSDGCKTCEEAKGPLLTLASAFSNQVDVLVLIDGAVTLPPQIEGQSHSYRAAQIDESLLSSLQIPGFPFCGIVNPVERRWLAPVTHAVDRIWMLFYVVTKLTSKAP